MMTKSKVREYWERYVFNVGCHGIRQLNDVYGKASDAKTGSMEPDSKRMCG